MPAKTDLGIGGISGSLLDAPGFLDVFSDDNRGGFTLNWGKDTTTANIPVSYTNLEGEVVYETWGYNALVTALVEKVYVRDGVEQSAWTSAEALIAAYVDMAGEEVESSADGTALAETFEGMTMAELAEEAGVDTMHAFTVATVSGKNYLFIVAETFGEFTLYKQQSLITEAGAAWAAWATATYGSSYGFTSREAVLLTDETIGANEYVQGLFDTDTEDVVVTTVQQFLELYYGEDPIPEYVEVYAHTYTYNGLGGDSSDVIIVQNINGYIVFLEWA